MLIRLSVIAEQKEKNMMPLVTIIIVNYNGYNDTVECIKSLNNIEYDNFQIIVVDNGSTKSDTASIKYIIDNCCYIFSDVNLGFSGGNNLGIKYAKENFSPEYYLLLNNDTVVKKDFLSKLVIAAEENKDAGIITGRIYYYDNPMMLWFAGGTFDLEYGIANHVEFNKIDYEKRIPKKEIEFATGCMILVPDKTIEKVGLLDESYFLYSEDADFSRRVRNAGLKIIYEDKSIIYHKVSKSSKSSDNVSYYMVRNNLILVKQYARKRKRAYIKFCISIIKAIICSEIELSIAVEAFRDFILHKTGKRGQKIEI